MPAETPRPGKTCSRRTFLKIVGTGLASLLLAGSFGRRPLKSLAQAGKRLPPRTPRPVTTDHDLAVARGRDAAAAARAAVRSLGGMERFVRRGDAVVVKPNIGWDRRPDQGANTHPEVVGALVAMAFEAGARMVKVFDNSCNDPRRSYESSGIAAAARKAGATVFYVSGWKFYPAAMPAGSLLKDWPVMKDAAECDCLINAPVAKHHSLTRLTLSMKNLMGACGGPRGELHQDIDRKLVELARFFRPDLTVIDATRILLRHGPTGGDLADLKALDTVIAARDFVLADAYAAALFGLEPGEVRHVRLAQEAGLGSTEVRRARIREISA